MVDRTLKELTDEDIQKVANTFRSWRGSIDTEYKDEQGFCKAASTKEVQDNEYILIPGRYVGFSEVEDDDESFEQKMERITADLSEQFAKSKEMEDRIRKSLEGLGYGV